MERKNENKKKKRMDKIDNDGKRIRIGQSMRKKGMIMNFKKGRSPELK